MAKQPNTYFVKGLRRVALELTEEGEFQLSSQTKYHPKTDEERLKVDELLAKQGQENVGLTPSNQEKQSHHNQSLLKKSRRSRVVRKKLGQSHVFDRK